MCRSFSGLTIEPTEGTYPPAMSNAITPVSLPVPSSIRAQDCPFTST